MEFERADNGATLQMRVSNQFGQGASLPDKIIYHQISLRGNSTRKHRSVCHAMETV